VFNTVDIIRKVKATLIVVPAGVMDQWVDEIRFHADKKTFPKVLKYRSSSNIPIEVLEDVEIVVTSYNEVQKQFPFPDKKSRAVIEKIGYKKWWAEAVLTMGDLHQASSEFSDIFRN
jgi:SNF2 family DNA or RNA helicase